MRLAERFRPQHVVNKTTKVNSKKKAKMIADNLALIAALSAKKAKKSTKAK